MYVQEYNMVFCMVSLCGYGIVDLFFVMKDHRKGDTASSIK